MDNITAPTTTNPQVKWEQIVLIVLLVVIVTLGSGYLGYLYGNNKASTSTTITQTTTPTATTTVTTTQGTTPTTTSSTYTGWQTYTDSVFGITIKYPTGWSAKSTDTTQAVSLSDCSVLKTSLRDPNSCTTSTLDHTFTISSNTNSSHYLTFDIYDSIGSAQPNPIAKDVVIMGKSYTLNLSNSNGQYSLLHKALPITSSTSIWNQVNTNLGTDSSDLDTILNILQSVSNT